MRIVDLGLACNNACVFCPQARLRATLGPAEQHASSISIEASDGVVMVMGGEPTLHADLPTLIRDVRERGCSVVMQTNARRLAYAKYVELLAGAGLGAIDVLLLGSTPPMHDFHTRVDGAWQQTIRGIANATQAGIAVAATVVVTRANYRHLHDIVRLSARLGVKAVQWRRAIAIDTSVRAQALVPPSTFVQPYVNQATREGRRAGVAVVEASSPAVGCVPWHEAQASLRVESRATSGAIDAVEARPRPAHAEHREREQRTGQALRRILPTLFERSGEEA